MKTVYLWLIRLVSLLNLWRPKKKIVYLMSFGNNVNFIKQLAQSLPQQTQIIVLYREEAEAAATDLAAFGLETIQFDDNLYFATQLIPVIMGAKIIFCDNYYAFLGGLVHSSRTKIVQLWHAAGAIKKFGWEDPITNRRSNSDKRRFQQVYNQFNEYIVGSEAMGSVFENSYHEPSSKMQLLGYPRSDRYLNQTWIQNSRERVYYIAPELKNKRVILYAPTYRENKSVQLPKGVSEALTVDPDAIVVIKLHPLLRKHEHELQRQNTAQIRFYHQLSTSELLTVTDTLITDYSSVAFDYSLLKSAKSIIFYMFDFDSYQQNPGIQDDFLSWLPSKPVKTLAELKTAILSRQETDFNKFNEKWNTYNDGQATGRVVQCYVKYVTKNNRKNKES